VSSIPPPLTYPHPGPPPDLPERPEGLPDRQPAWPPWTAPVALVAGFAVAIFGYIVLGAIAGAAGADVDNLPAGVDIAATVIQDGALIGSALVFARMSSRPRPSQFGLRPARLWSSAGWLALTWFGFFLFSVIWVAALGITEKDDLPEQLGADESTAALVAVRLLVCVVAPVAEEVFFRGYFFTALRNWRGCGPRRSSPVSCSEPSMPVRRPSGTSSRSPSSGLGCACSTGRPARCTRASRFTRSTTQSPSA
jgi:membrane protease YdiL (CAAX protease family)